MNLSRRQVRRIVRREIAAVIAPRCIVTPAMIRADACRSAAELGLTNERFADLERLCGEQGVAWEDALERFRNGLDRLPRLEPAP